MTGRQTGRVLSAAEAARAAARPTEVRAVGGEVWWSESRPEEGGRVALVRPVGGVPLDVLGDAFSVRSRVHEYGGGAWWVGRRICFVDDASQRIWMFDPPMSERSPQRPEPRPLSRPAVGEVESRHADGTWSPDGRWVVCVRETVLTNGRARHELVCFDTSSEDPEGVDPTVLWQSTDFVASPAFSPDGRHLAWIGWNHPDMPWDHTFVYAGFFTADGAPRVEDVRIVAGGAVEESCLQPSWDEAGVLHWISDRSGWWNLVCAPEPGLPPAEVKPVEVTALEAEVGTPMWNLGVSRYCHLPGGRILAAFTSGGRDSLVLVEAGRECQIETPWTWIGEVREALGGVALIAAGHDQLPGVYFSDESDLLRPGTTESGRGRVGFRPLRSFRLPADADDVPVPEHLVVPTDEGELHAYLYLPGTKSADGRKPPLMIRVHGGPTSAARLHYTPEVHFWTSRGFAVGEVDYRGSTGYGRSYRKALEGRWCELDVRDCVAAAEHLVESGLVDPRRIVIRGSSAGGATVLLALAESDVFAAGVALYPVCDLLTLASQTHEFERSYNDRLLGPLPECEDLYRRRSPLARVAQIRGAVLVMQGTEDRVVPPSQVESLVAELEKHRIPHAVAFFEGEGHGFRHAANRARALEVEAAFYCRVLGMRFSDTTIPLEVRHLGGSR
ncbi:MAG: peptidase [Acidimicrobiales bacterium]|nr:MAG: peptidase [Acidimicrobiales bacterium]